MRRSFNLFNFRRDGDIALRLTSGRALWLPAALFYCSFLFSLSSDERQVRVSSYKRSSRPCGVYVYIQR